MRVIWILLFTLSLLGTVSNSNCYWVEFDMLQHEALEDNIGSFAFLSILVGVTMLMITWGVCWSMRLNAWVDGTLCWLTLSIFCIPITFATCKILDEIIGQVPEPNTHLGGVILVGVVLVSSKIVWHKCLSKCYNAW